VLFRSGQVWRLLTPIFIHFSFLHLLFNMLWLKDLGTIIEVRQGAGRLVLLVAILAVASNVGQYLVSGPNFGGMSGVVYGLLAYIWMRGKCDPFSGYFIHPQIFIMMMIWFFLCLTGLLGNIANTAHAVGLVVGIIMGCLPKWMGRFSK
jgi:GlpG protein